MPTYIELHLLSYFATNFLMLLSCKILFKKNAKIWCVVLCALMLATLKLIMDIYFTNIFAQIAVIILCSQCLMVFLFKVNHVSRLVAYLAIFLAFNLTIFALQAAFCAVISKSTINYISNYYLLCQIGFALIVFWLVNIFAEYKHIIQSENFVRNCELLIDTQKIALCGFIDTGNKLVDKASKLSIVVVNISSIKNHVSRQLYADLILSTNSSGKLQSVGKIKYSTLTGTSYLTIFKPKKFLVSGKNVDCMVGISASNQIQNYDALLGASFA